MKFYKYGSMVLVVISFAIAIYFYPTLPEKIVTHWNAQGIPDGWGSKFTGLFTFPLTMLFIFFLMLLIPKIDPLRKNIQKFLKMYYAFFFFLLLFFIFVQLQTTLWNAGIEISPNIFFPIGLSFLMYIISLLLTQARRNWFVGIRTPWTISSEEVWNKTHKLGALLFKLVAIIVLIGVIFPRYSIYFVLIPVLSVAVFLVIYSYILYTKIEEKGEKV